MQKKLTDAKAKLATVTDPRETAILQHEIDGLEMQLNKRLLEDRIQSVNSQLGGATTQEAADVIRKRINPTGTKEVIVTSMGANRIRIQLPFKSRTDLTPEEAEAAFQREVSDIKSIIEKTGSLSFLLVISGGAHSEDIIKEAEKDYKERLSPPVGYFYGIPEEEYRAMAKELEAQGKPVPLGYLEIKEDTCFLMPTTGASRVPSLPALTPQWAMKVCR
jgi:preprotein translocase subunit SecD